MGIYSSDDLATLFLSWGGLSDPPEVIGVDVELIAG